MKDVVIIGAGNFGREVAWLIEDINNQANMYRILGYLDDTESLIGQTVQNYKVLGNIEYLSDICQNNKVCCIIAMQDTNARKSIVEKLEWFDEWENLIHPSAIISDRTILGKGNIIAANNTLSVDVTIGNHCLLNIGCTIGHDCVLDDYVSIMSNSALGGGVKIREGAYLGTTVSVVPGKTIGEFSKVGIGSVVIRDVKSRTTVMGNPAKLLKF